MIDFQHTHFSVTFLCNSVVLLIQIFSSWR